MFMFPEPPPIDHYIAEISQHFLSDGILLHGKFGPTHKCIAKQLRPIKRTLNDPIASIEELDPRILDKWLEREKDGYVDRCGRDGPTIHKTFLLIRDLRSSYPKYQRPKNTIFPRSPQYELSYRRQTRNKPQEKHLLSTAKSSKTTDGDKIGNESCDLLTRPYRWKEESRKPTKLPLEDINEYTITCVTAEEEKNAEVERSNGIHFYERSMDKPDNTKYLEDGSTADLLLNADSCKCKNENKQTLPKDVGTISEEFPRGPHRTHCNDATNVDCNVGNAYGRDFDTDRRWQPAYETITLPQTDVQRMEELQRLSKPFLHDLHIWYARNKPTKAIQPVKYAGKRPKPEWRFSHL